MKSPVVVLGWLALFAWLVVAPARADDSALMQPTPEMFRAPVVHPAPGFTAEGVEALFFEGVSYRGKPTKVFAWLGLPKIEAPPAGQPAKKVPGIVLVHGGGGTAFDAWVRLWTSRGYAAIAMDTTGSVPRGSYGKWERHPDGGPSGNDFEGIDQPLGDQWQYHAVADVLLAHSLLRSRPEVDPDRIGLTGISWGGYLTCVASGLDDRFQFAVPVYGTGYLGDESLVSRRIAELGEKGQKWLATWDPSHYLKQSKMPFLWVTGTNDFAFTLKSLQQSAQATQGPSTLCVRLRMPHGHNGPGENPEEIRLFADAIVNGGKPLGKISPRVNDRGGEPETAGVWCTSETPLVKAELLYTTAAGPWKDRLWETLPAELSGEPQFKAATAVLPEGTTVYYFNFIDDRGCVVSSPLVEVPAP